MTNAQWFILIGLLLLGRGLTSTILRRSPFSSSIFYLAVGIVAGPMVLGAFHFDPLGQSALLELLTEIAVLISLFSAGVKMPVPFKLARWRAPIRLAWVSMTLTVALVAAFAYFVLGLPLGAGVLLGAILAPTDPVLATDVQSRHPGDKDHLRFTLTCEAGMNDGTAFPFVMLGLGLLGLHGIGDFGGSWLLRDVMWATVIAVLIGVISGTVLARIGLLLRGQHPKHEVLDDLVGLGLIALAYGLSVSLHAWGFLTVFFAGVALRQAEVRLSGRRDQPAEKSSSSDPDVQGSAPIEEDDSPQIVSAETLIFEEHLERLSELLLVLLLGGMLLPEFWNWRTVGLALFVFAVARPVSVFIGLIGTGTSLRIKGMSGWFGVRGIGSIYYLMYAIQHGLPRELAMEMVQLTLTVVTLSILLHGTSVKPLMLKFWGHAK